MDLHPQMEETIKLMERKVLKKHKCEADDIAFGQPSFGADAGHGRKEAKINYVYRRKLRGIVRYDGVSITVTPGGR